MFHGLVEKAGRTLGRWQRSLFGQPVAQTSPAESPQFRTYRRIQQWVLTEEVNRTLFQEYAVHRASNRGNEEIGWLLLGIREVDRALVLATLPAGAQRSAGVTHVQFNSTAQALGSRIVRQWDKRLTTLGVVHTHPGSLRHPSDGDFQGDSQWVRGLRGGEGVFGIGTADGAAVNTRLKGVHEPHVQTQGELLFSWYALGQDDHRYRPQNIRLITGPDLASRLRDVWPTVETFAEPLERLCRQQAGVSFDIVESQKGAALAICLKLAEPNTALRMVLNGHQAAVYWQNGGELRAVDLPGEPLDRGVYLILAELAERYGASHSMEQRSEEVISTFQ